MRTGAALLASVALVACNAPPPDDPLYVSVVLTSAAPGKVQDAFVEVLDDRGSSLTSFCLKLDASFDLKRAFGADPAKQVTVVVTPEGGVSGDQDANPGAQFSCDGAKLPMPAGAPQSVTLSFCAQTAPDAMGVDRHAPRELRFQVGATCGKGCGDGQVCGAGLSTSASECHASECCSSTIGDPCALLPSK